MIRMLLLACGLASGLASLGPAACLAEQDRESAGQTGSPSQTPAATSGQFVASSHSATAGSENDCYLPIPLREVRGTWVTTTANDAISSPPNTALTMRRLAEIGLNTVYVEVWKNGYTQFPSETLKRTIGVDRRPALVPQDPSDTPEQLKRPARDLLAETLIEAHRNGLIYNAWFEYGFMAAHKSTDNHLRRMKAEWLSRDKNGGEVAPNGFVWMNPLHPEARQFLLDLVIEAVDKYDLDGIQLDDRIVWPYITMGYDDYTKQIYAKEHDGKQPPLDEKDPAWMRWRADKVTEYAKRFVTEVRARRPGLTISLSPAVYPWCYEHYLLEWPKWASWTSESLGTTARGPAMKMGWDEFIPQCYRFNYKAFEQTWLDQVKWMKQDGGGRVHDLLAGIRVVGEGPNATWDELRQSMDLVRSTGGGGSVLWFSRGVLDVYPNELTAYYKALPTSGNPMFPANWRPLPTPLVKPAKPGEAWTWSGLPQGPRYQLITKVGDVWSFVPTPASALDGNPARDVVTPAGSITLPENVVAAEWLVDRREDLKVKK